MQTSTSLTSGIKEPKLPQWFQTWFGSEPKNTNKQRKRYEPRNTGQLLFLKTNCVAEFSCRDPGLTMYWPRLRSPAVSLGSSLMTLNSEPLLWLNAGAALRRFTEQLQEEEKKKKTLSQHCRKAAGGVCATANSKSNYVLSSQKHRLRGRPVSTHWLLSLDAARTLNHTVLAG